MGVTSETPGDMGLPGVTTRVDQKVRQILRRSDLVEIWPGGIIIKSDTVDAGNTPTTVLRPGLVLVRIEAGGDKGKYVQFGHASAPNEAALKQCVILRDFVDMRKSDGVTVEDKQAAGISGGYVNETQVIYVTGTQSTIDKMKLILARVSIIPNVV